MFHFEGDWNLNSTCKLTFAENLQKITKILHSYPIKAGNFLKDVGINLEHTCCKQSSV